MDPSSRPGVSLLQSLVTGIWTPCLGILASRADSISPQRTTLVEAAGREESLTPDVISLWMPSA